MSSQNDPLARESSPVPGSASSVSSSREIRGWTKSGLVFIGVALAVLVVAVLYPGGPFQLGTPGSMPIGTSLYLSNATLARCGGSSSFAAQGCAADHYSFSVSVTNASLDLSEFGLRIINGSHGVWTSVGADGFSILSAANQVIAQCTVSGGVMSMSSGWVYQNGAASGTPLTSSDRILIDVGPDNPVGVPLYLVAFGVSGTAYSGTTGPLPLP